MRASCLQNDLSNHLCIAVFVSNYNTSERLRRTLESLRHQSYTHFDVYLIDAGSSDDFLSVASEYSDILFSVSQREDSGLYDGLAQAFASTQPEYNVYSYLNAGDLYQPYCLEVVARTFSFNTVEWITGLPSTVDSQYHLTCVNKPLPYVSAFIANFLHSGSLLPAIQQESCFWSASLHAKIPLSKFGSLRYAGDSYLWSEFSRLASLKIVNCSLAAFTVHGDHLSSRGYHKELRLQRANLFQVCWLYPFAMIYGLVQRFLRLPESIYGGLPGIINPVD